MIEIKTINKEGDSAHIFKSENKNPGDWIPPGGSAHSPNG